MTDTDLGEQMNVSPWMIRRQQTGVIRNTMFTKAITPHQLSHEGLRRALIRYDARRKE